MRSNGSYIGPRPTGPSASTAGGIWSLRDAERLARSGTWVTGPSAPQPLAATPGDTEMTLAWTAPADLNAGGSIVDYEVEYSTDGTSWTVFSDGVSTTTSATVTGLTNDVEYQFRVRARSNLTGAYATVTGTPTAVFSPSDITGLSAWFDASDSSTLYNATTGGSLVAADGQVARWEDKSGNARHATQGTAANRPLRKTASISGLDALLFDGSNDGLSFSGNIENGSGYVSLYVVARKTSTSGIGFLLNKDDFNVSPRAHQFLRINDALVETHWWTPTLQNPTKGNVVANTTFLASLRLGSDSGFVGLNGVDGTADTDVSGTTTTNQPTQIGSYLASQNFFGGHICEIVAYDNKISNTDADAVESYLMTKWGIT